MKSRSVSGRAAKDTILGRDTNGLAPVCKSRKCSVWESLCRAMWYEDRYCRNDSDNFVNYEYATGSWGSTRGSADVISYVTCIGLLAIHGIASHHVSKLI